MSRLYTTQPHGHVSLPRGAPIYLYRVQEAITILADMYDGPKYQRDIVNDTKIAGCKVQSILSQLYSRGLITRHRRVPSADTYYYDLTVIAKLWLMQQHPEMLKTEVKA